MAETTETKNGRRSWGGWFGILFLATAGVLGLFGDMLGIWAWAAETGAARQFGSMLAHTRVAWAVAGALLLAGAVVAILWSLTDLLRRVRQVDQQLGLDLEKKVVALTKRRNQRGHAGVRPHQGQGPPDNPRRDEYQEPVRGAARP